MFDKLMKTDNTADFHAACADIKARRISLQLDIQRYLVAVATRWNETGDVRPAVERINMLISKEITGEGIRRNTLLEYIEQNLGLQFVTEGDNKGKFIAGKAKAKALDFTYLNNKATHWYNAVPEKPYQPMMLNVMLGVMLKKATARSEKATEADDLPADRLEALANLHRQWAAEDAVLAAEKARKDAADEALANVGSVEDTDA